MSQPVTEPTTVDPAPAPTPTPAPPAPAPAPPAPKTADDGGRGGKDAILADLAKERDARKVLEGQMAKLAAAFGVEATKSGKTDLDALTERVAAQEARAAAAELRAMRAEVAQDKKLPAGLAGRLVGTTKEELAVDADALLALFPQAGATPAKTEPPAPTGETPPEPAKPNGPAPDPSQGPKGTGPTARPTSLFDAIRTATTPK